MQKLGVEHRLGRTRNQDQRPPLGKLMIDPFLQDAGQAGIAIRPVGKLVKDEQSRKPLPGKQTEEFTPAPGSNVAQDGERFPQLLGGMDQLLLGRALHRLMVHAAEPPAGLLQQGRLAHAAAPGHVSESPPPHPSLDRAELFRPVPELHATNYA